MHISPLGNKPMPDPVEPQEEEGMNKIEDEEPIEMEMIDT